MLCFPIAPDIRPCFYWRWSKHAQSLRMAQHICLCRTSGGCLFNICAPFHPPTIPSFSLGKLTSFPFLTVQMRFREKYFYFSSMEFTKEMFPSSRFGSERCKAYNLEMEQMQETITEKNKSWSYLQALITLISKLKYLKFLFLEF